MANIVKAGSSLPQPIQDLIAGIEPAGLVKNVGAVGVGFGAAMLGGRLAKQVDAIERFAAGGTPQEILVDALAGLALDALPLAGVYFATREEHGNSVTLKVAKLMVAGTLLGALIPNLSQVLSDAIEKVVDFIVGLVGAAPKGSTAVEAAASAAAALPPAGGGSFYDRAPGGNLYSLAGM